MFQPLDSVITECGIAIVDPKVLQQAISGYDISLQKFKIVSLLAIVNNAVANRVAELTKVRSTREIGAVIRVNIESMFSKSCVEEVVRQLEAVGYTIMVGYNSGSYDGPGYSTGPFDWLEIYV